MLHSRFFWRLYSGYIIFILLSSTVISNMVAARIAENTLKEINLSLEVKTRLLHEVALFAFKNRPNNALQARIKSLGEKTDTRFTIIMADGLVIADSVKNPLLMDKHESRPEVLSAILNDFGTSTRFSNTIGTQMLYLAIAVRQDGQLKGFVRTALPLSGIESKIAHQKNIIFLGTGMSAFVAILLGFWMAIGFVKPIISMAKVAEAMPTCDYKERLPITWRDETGRLASALNSMAESCQQRLETISTEKNKVLTILSGMSEGVIAIDSDEKVLHINEAAEKILGVLDNCLNKPLWEVTRIREVCEIMNDLLKSKDGLVKELRFIVQPEEKVVSMNASVLHNGNGEITGAIIVLHDISELHRLEVVRRDFVANASHELKTPITAIRNIIETILDDKEMEPTARNNFLSRAMKQTIRLSSLVSDLLTISRLEAKDPEQEKEPFDLRDIISTSVNALKPMGTEKGIEITTQITTDAVLISGDEDSLCQAVSNLLDNALKYTKSGGKVSLKLTHASNIAAIEITDTGIGIAPGETNRIFERFYRIDKARSRELGGTGLGLSIVKHIVLAHAGHVSVKSVPESGSSFLITLPTTNI